MKEMGVDDNGQPTINGRPMLKFRIEKKMPQDKWSSKSKELLKKGELKEARMKITRKNLRKVIREALLPEAMQSWEERQAEMAAWEKKLREALPDDLTNLNKSDMEKLAKVYIDEFGLDNADGFYEEDRWQLGDWGVSSNDLEEIYYTISDAQSKEHQKEVDASPHKKELQAIGGDSYGAVAPREVEYLTYQPIRRGGKVVAFEIEDSETEWGTMPLGHSTFVVDEKWAKQYGTTVDKIIKVLEKGGATLRKKRKPIKRTTPYYD